MKKILCIHGIGHKEANTGEWQHKWETAISQYSNTPVAELKFDFLKFDEIFEHYERINGIRYGKAILKLISDWIHVSVFEGSRVFGIREKIRWHAGMVVQFVEDSQLRNALQQSLISKLDEFKPDLIFSHSLGTLVAYDLFRQEVVKGKSRDLTLVTSGSQIGHPALKKFFGGIILPLNVNSWINLHNQNDKVFAYESINVEADNYMEVETPFTESKLIMNMNHDVYEYINHENAVHYAWPAVFEGLSKSLSRGKLSGARKAKLSINRSKSGITENKNKVLLVGIDDYPNPEDKLYGCMNDVFRMSEVLQEAGIAPDNIKVVLNERATAANLRSSMKWLLSDAKKGDFRFFFYSGHGAQIPSDGMEGEEDSKDECLVTYDFDWTRENAYTDKEFLRAYSQLPYEVDFLTVLDCCHSGGLARDGIFRARGITPPDDIRHRTIKWDAKRQMWISRDSELSKKKLFSPKKSVEERTQFIGKQNNVYRFGRGVHLWNEYDKFEKSKATYGTKGPYMPLIIESCREDQYAYEYKHGVVSFGAFTYCLSTILRDHNRESKGKKNRKRYNYGQLIKLVGARLKELGYDQIPQIVGPSIKIKRQVPVLKI